jgi:hypothetical protein
MKTFDVTLKIEAVNQGVVEDRIERLEGATVVSVREEGADQDGEDGEGDED